MTNNITNFSGEISKSRVILWAIYTAWKVSKYGVISGPYSPVFSPNTGKYGPEITPYLVTQCTPNGHIQQQLSNIFLGKLQIFQFPVFQKKCFLMKLYSFRTSARNSIFSKDAGCKSWNFPQINPLNTCFHGFYEHFIHTNFPHKKILKILCTLRTTF